VACNGLASNNLLAVLRTFLRRYGLIIYWLCFAILTLRAAKYPGLVYHRESVPYPWIGVVTTWIILGAMTSVLYWISRTRKFRYVWQRLAVALVFALILLLFTFLTFVTDMPGYYYVPGQFALATTAGAAFLGIAYVVGALWRRLH
jgi:hypothetical protein